MSVSAVSVVVPARDAASTLPALLEGLRGQSVEGGWETLVVDNGSTDGTGKLARAAGARVIEYARPGAAAARNAGIRAAESDLVAFLDADCIPRPNWLAPLVEELRRREDLGGVGGRIVAAAPGTLLESYAERRRYVSQEGALAEPIAPYLLTASCCYRRDALERLGGLDESLRSGEDLDLSWRLQRELGLGVALVRDSVVEHVHRSTLQGIWSQWVRYGYGEAQLAVRYPRPAAREMSAHSAVSWVTERAMRFARAAAGLPAGRSTSLDVAEPLLEYFEEAAERVGRRRGARAESKE